MPPPPRVAYFADSFLEVNGVARTSAALEACARERALPFLTVHAGPGLQEGWRPEDGGRLQLPRGPVALRLEADLWCDLLIWRHQARVRRALETFRPDLIHITGPNDLGQLGAWLAWRLGIPLVASWHTNVHEFAARRVGRRLARLPSSMRARLMARVERRVLQLASLFYQGARLVLAPTDELVTLLHERTGRPTRLMRRGIDTAQFSPAHRDVSDGIFRLGYVGRLSPEKNVRMLADVGHILVTRGAPPFRFVVVGDGNERAWLERHLPQAEFRGVLLGQPLARAYANLDALLFPSATDTFGLVVLEALASGTPPVVTPFGGPKTIIEADVSGLVAETPDQFADAVLGLMRNPGRHAAMRQAARAQALPASWPHVFDTVLDAWTAVLEAPERDVRTVIEA